MVKHPEIMLGSRCSSMVRVFAHGAMGRQINPCLVVIQVKLQ